MLTFNPQIQLSFASIARAFCRSEPTTGLGCLKGAGFSASLVLTCLAMKKSGGEQAYKTRVKNASMKLAIIGTGSMGGAIARAVRKKFSLVLNDRSMVKARKVAKEAAGRAEKDVKAAVGAADAVILAVKPKDMEETLAQIANSTKNKLVISIAAGVPLKFLERKLKEARIVRVMPNTPLMVGKGASAFFIGRRAGAKDANTVKKIFGSAGEVIEVKREELLDVVTGLSGCGPAFVYLFINAMAREARRLGLKEEEALKLAAQTFAGAAEMVLKSGKKPADLIKMVASPKGTTVEGLDVLYKKHAAGIIARAVGAAARRATEIRRAFK